MDLEFELEGQKIKSKLIAKDNDQDEIYTDSLASGNTSMYIKDEKNTINILLKWEI